MLRVCRNNSDSSYLSSLSSEIRECLSRVRDIIIWDEIKRLRKENQKLKDWSNKQSKLISKLTKLAIKKTIEVKDVDIDNLTWLNNREFFDSVFPKQISQAIRLKNPLSLMVIDIDHFKDINDTHGHPVWDIILKELSKIMMNNIRQSDILCRWWWEEFVCILPDTDDVDWNIVASKLLKVISNSLIDIWEETLSITVSIGLCKLSEKIISENTPEEIASLMFYAWDRALYVAKWTWRNRISIIWDEWQTDIL